MSLPARKDVLFPPRRKAENLPDYSDRVVFDHYMRSGYVPNEVKEFQLLAHHWARLKALRDECLAQRHFLQSKYDPEEARVPAGESDGGEWTSDGDNDADDGSGGAAAALDDAIKKLEETADLNKTSRGQCARAVREALFEGGITVTPPAPSPGNRAASAADYGPSFEKAGADIVASAQRDLGPADYPPANYTPQKGDVIVFERFPGHSDGHTAMYNGNQWISDFRQNSPWPNQSGAKNYGPSYKIYRFRQFDD